MKKRTIEELFILGRLVLLVVVASGSVLLVELAQLVVIAPRPRMDLHDVVVTVLAAWSAVGVESSRHAKYAVDAAMVELAFSLDTSLL